MDTQLEQIREQQRETWNKFSPGWKKWDEFTMDFLKPMGDAIIQKLEIKEKDSVLDIACGTGEPGLTIAKLATKGNVTGTDLAEQMLEIAAENARHQDIQNFQTRGCDVCDLPFETNAFDKISCRMGFMFFPDMQLASDQMYRVLKPGGKMATSVWAGPEKNVWVTAIMGIIQKHMNPAPPPVGAPSMFRCAKPGFLKGIMETSGFKNVTEESVTGKVIYKDFDLFWTMMNEVAAPVVGALSKADDAMKQQIQKEVKEACARYQTSAGLALDYHSLILSGEK
ncbi:MAG: methyltransferase domain-containing protein [Ginsengibacter sp.]